MITEAKEGNFKRMDVMHHLLAGYKAVFSERNLLGIEVARKACGGAGYSSNSGIPVLFFNNSPIPTYEGDNTVMMLQASRYLKKLKSKSKKGQVLKHPFTYLNQMVKLTNQKESMSTIDDFTDLDLLQEAI
jgi:hypothetical protein